jgi:hypothetical protein
LALLVTAALLALLELRLEEAFELLALEPVLVAALELAAEEAVELLVPALDERDEALAVLLAVELDVLVAGVLLLDESLLPPPPPQALRNRLRAIAPKIRFCMSITRICGMVLPLESWGRECFVRIVFEDLANSFTRLDKNLNPSAGWSCLACGTVS